MKEAECQAGVRIRAMSPREHPTTLSPRPACNLLSTAEKGGVRLRCVGKRTGRTVSTGNDTVSREGVRMLQMRGSAEPAPEEEFRPRLHVHCVLSG